MAKKRNWKLLGVLVDQRQYGRLAAIAAERGTTLSDTVRHALYVGLGTAEAELARLKQGANNV